MHNKSCMACEGLTGLTPCLLPEVTVDSALDATLESLETTTRFRVTFLLPRSTPARCSIVFTLPCCRDQLRIEIAIFCASVSTTTRAVHLSMRCMNCTCT